MRALLPLLAALIALLPAALGGRAGPPAPVRFKALPVEAATARAGRLVLTAGWALHSRDRRFGGLSALTALGPGRLLALSDSAVPVLIDLTGAAGPVARVLPALNTGADPRSGKSGSDTESLARDPLTGTLWVGLERRNAIVRYGPALVRDRRRRPDAMTDWPANGGAESMARLPDGQLLVIAETARTVAGTRTALLFPVDPMSRREVTPAVFAYRPPAGYDPSDAAPLPDGRVLVLNRRVGLPDGFSAIVTIIDPRHARAGQMLSGTEIARIARPMAVDNLEGIAVSQERDGTIMYLVSDDNFLPAERTLLLRYRLEM